MEFQGKVLRKEDYCHCKGHTTVTSVLEENGYWLVCCNCLKPLECEFHYYNHYDGEDHDEYGE